MKKNLFFLIPLVMVSVLLFMFKKTGMSVHIAVSVVGLVLLVAYALITKKDWKCPVLEILERVFYGVALITGVVIMNVHGIATVGIVHKASAALFALLLFVTEFHKLIKNN